MDNTMTPEPRNEAAEREALARIAEITKAFDISMSGEETFLALAPPRVKQIRDIARAALAAERAAPTVDVERLADFIRDKIESEPYQGLHPELASMGLAVALRDEWPEYARLAGEAEHE